MVVRKLHKGRPAGEEWKNDWDKNGHLRIQHTPCGKPPAMDAYGIEWLILVEGRVILTGYELSRNFPWMLESQRPSVPAPAKAALCLRFVTWLFPQTGNKAITSWLTI